MTNIRDAIRDASSSELDEMVQERRITPDKLWDELLDSAGRSAALLGGIVTTNRALIRFLDKRLPELAARQDRIDKMLAGELTNSGVAGIDLKTHSDSNGHPSGSRRLPKAKRNG